MGVAFGIPCSVASVQLLGKRIGRDNRWSGGARAVRVMSEFISCCFFGQAHLATACVLATGTRGGFVTGDLRLVYFFASSCPDAQAHQRILPFLYYYF